jgi:cell division protein FtsA
MNNFIKQAGKKNSNTIAVLDIGSTKVVCFIAHFENGELNITGIGHQLSQGFRAGVVTDPKSLENSILAAISNAEEMAGETIDKILLGVCGNIGHSSNLSVELDLSNGQVSRRNLMELIDSASDQIYDPDLELIHCFPLEYRLDGTSGIKDPVGMFGENLEAWMHLYSLQTNPLRNIIKCIGHCHLEVDDLVLLPYAAGLACLEDEPSAAPVMLIEMGGATTTATIFIGLEPVYSRTVPVGGIQVTGDISKVLSITFAEAERLKVIYGSAVIGSVSGRDKIEIPGARSNHDEDESAISYITRSELVDIIRPRVEETFEMLRDALISQGFSELAYGRMILTGGASQLAGVAELANEIYGRKPRVASPRLYRGLADATQTPAFTAALGLMEYALYNDKFSVHSQFSGFRSKPLNRIYKWFVENF